MASLLFRCGALRRPPRAGGLGKGAGDAVDRPWELSHAERLRVCAGGPHTAGRAGRAAGAAAPRVGDGVTVVEDFGRLRKGQTGRVVEVDRDGDARLRVAGRSEWVALRPANLSPDLCPGGPPGAGADEQAPRGWAPDRLCDAVAAHGMGRWGVAFAGVPRGMLLRALRDPAVALADAGLVPGACAEDFDVEAIALVHGRLVFGDRPW
eukprot:gene15804-15832_t